MKRFGKFVLIFLLVFLVGINYVKATGGNSETSEIEVINEQQSEENKNTNGSVPFETNAANVNTENIEKSIDDIKEKSESIMYKIIKTVGDISLPICFLLVLWGAVLYFILGIRNLYKKRQGLLLMWGAITFVVIAKILVLVGWFVFEYKA